MSRDRQAANPTINIQSALRTAPYLCKNFSLQCYLVASVIHIQSLRSQICVVYTHLVQSGDAGRGKERKIWDSSELRVPEVRHPRPRGTDIASRLLRKPKNSYMLLILLLLLLVVVVSSPWASLGRNQSPVRRPVWLW